MSYRDDKTDPSSTTEIPELICYPLDAAPPEIVPAASARDWMDATDRRFAYRCVPLCVANASGWEILSPAAFEATWTGGQSPGAVTIRAKGDRAKVARLVTSHFGAGVLTFHVAYLFRTSPGWALWVRGSPNRARRNLAPLEGLVETDWLDFPFTMNWRFTRPSTVSFEAGEPFCFITPVPHLVFERIEPRIASLKDDPRLSPAYEARHRGRAELIGKERPADKDAIDGRYVRGEDATGNKAALHVASRKLRPVRR